MNCFFIKTLILVVLLFVTNSNGNKELNTKCKPPNRFEQVKRSLDFTGKVALVTGSNSGIGAETVRLLSYLGSNVVVTGRDRKRIAQVAKECRVLSPKNLKPLEIAADLTKYCELEKLVHQTIKTFGKIDILVNNAGIGKRAKLLDKNYSSVFTEVTAINEVAVLQLTRLVVPYLNQTNGTIINIASIEANIPSIGLSAYDMSKAALVQLTRVLALELAPNIRVNSLSPGLVPCTRIFRYSTFTDEEVARVFATIALGRTGVPLDIAKGVVFLASDMAAWIDGFNLKINGGVNGGWN